MNARPAGPERHDGCVAEPIRVPGAIQPHGWLLGLRGPELTVATASANVDGLVGADAAELVGRRLEDGAAASLADAVRSLLDADASALEAANPVEVELADGRYDVVLHRAGGLLVAELEPGDDTGEGAPGGGGGGGGGGALGWYRTLRGALHRLPRAGSVSALADELTDVVAELTGFDRVMAYRFTPEWEGEVVAERRRDTLEPFLGLRYPAGDIPAQARELYTTNWLRLIPTSTYTPVPLVPDRDPLGGGPLDLGGAMLRSVSPVHLEYLRNMGVAASMSVSLIAGGRLWGLIACHHYAGAHRPPYRVRAAAEMLGRTASILVEQRETADRAQRRAGRAALRTRVTAAIATGDEEAAPVAARDLVALLDAGGVAVRLGGALLGSGATLERPAADAVAAALLGPAGDEPVGATDNLAALDPRWAALGPEVAGALAVRVGTTADRYVLWTRPEWRREVTWAGDPHHQEAEPAGDGRLRISPRQSFAAWVEHVRLRSRPWDAADLDEAADLGRSLSDVVLRQAFERSEVAAALQRTLLAEEVPAVAGLDVAVAYRPGGHQPVGGDWFDVLSLPDGRCSLALGDVAGHGLMLSAVTAQLRQGLRAYLLREAGPHEALRRLNELVAWVLPDDLATALVAELLPATGDLRWASAGHLPPLVAAGPRSRFLEGRRGPALGASAGAAFGASSASLAEGEVLVLYSDGLIERRGEPIDAGMERLRATAAGLPADPQILCDGLVERLGAAGRPDDVTVLAVGRQPA